MNHTELKTLHSAHRKANEQRYEAHSKETLKRNITTKFKTTMIGALSKFEDMFGDLWGHGKDDYELNRQQAELKKRWDIVRTEILNNGNNQLRAAIAEVDQYTIRYNKTEYNFILRNKGELTRDE